MEKSKEIYLFHQGTYYHAYNLLGCHPEDNGSWFRVWAPTAKAISVVGDFNGWAPDDDNQIMTYDMEKHCLVKTGATVTENGWKFTSNGNWNVNYGGDLKALSRDGANIEVVGSTICLFLENTKTSQGVIYATVE